MTDRLEFNVIGDGEIKLVSPSPFYVSISADLEKRLKKMVFNSLTKVNITISVETISMIQEPWRTAYTQIIQKLDDLGALWVQVVESAKSGFFMA